MMRSVRRVLNRSDIAIWIMLFFFFGISLIILSTRLTFQDPNVETRKPHIA